VQARVNDRQWDWLEERAVEYHEGDMSKAIRDCIDWSRIAVEILAAPDPHAKLDEIRERGESEADRLEITMDEEPDARVARETTTTGRSAGCSCSSRETPWSPT
jgi:hypothetical protein